MRNGGMYDSSLDAVGEPHCCDTINFTCLFFSLTGSRERTWYANRCFKAFLHQCIDNCEGGDEACAPVPVSIMIEVYETESDVGTAIWIWRKRMGNLCYCLSATHSYSHESAQRPQISFPQSWPTMTRCGVISGLVHRGPIPAEVYL